MTLRFNYPVILEPDEDGRLVVLFPDLPETATDGPDEHQALGEAADCLSEALAARIANGEEIPLPRPALPGQHVVSPDPTIALKAALYMVLQARAMTVADLAELLAVEWHQAARLIDPKRASKLTSLEAALSALACRIEISITGAGIAEAMPAGSSAPPTVAAGQEPRASAIERGASFAGSGSLAVTSVTYHSVNTAGVSTEPAPEDAKSRRNNRGGSTAA